jgi:flagellar basal-body rod modification protein FlgD
MSSTVNPLNDSSTSVSTTGTTSSGNKIVTTTGGSMDKTAFLKILAAEMSNLDPSQDQDSTAYVTQMAQFASIEQMTNLNSTMTQSSYEQLVGKGVTMTDTDTSGNAYTGIVKSVSTDSAGTTYLGVAVTENGSTAYKTFAASDIASIIDSSDTATSAAGSTALNTSFLAASALKGQDVVVSTTDSSNNTVKVSGTIKSVYIDNGVVKIKVTTADGTTKEYPYSSVLQAGDLTSTTTA